MEILLLMPLVCLVLLWPRRASATLRAGAAVRVVTPDPLLPVTSGLGSSRPAREKHMDLEVRALCLEQDETTAAIVSVPFIGFPRHFCEQVCAAVPEVPASHILIGATHTHTGPDPYGFPDDQGEYGIDLAYWAHVCVRTAEAIREAHAALRPVHMKAATGDARGKIAYNFYAPELYDPRCHVLQFMEPGGAPLATLVNYAIHPEILLHREVCSPDLVGPLHAAIEAGGGGTALFMNSAQGGMVTADIRTPQGDMEDWSECVRIGELLASEALRIAAGGEVLEDPPLHCHSHTLSLPVKEVMGQLMMMIHPEVRPWDTPPQSIETRQDLLRLGNVHMLTLPGEVLPNIGFFLKRKMRGKHNLLFGLTNDAFGYLMTRIDYDSFARYEYITQTSLHEEAGEVLVAESLKLIEAAR
jgi:hypothetical protein